MNLRNEFLLFSVVGAGGTLAHYAVLMVLTGILQMNAVLGSTAGAFVGASLNYLCNHRYTFRAKDAHREAVPRYAAAVAFGFVLNAACMGLLVSTLRWHYLAAQVATSAVVLFANFALNRFWVFRRGIS